MSKSKTTGLTLIVVGIGLALWKCRYSIDLTDEAAYLVPGFKLLGLGDLPFRDEIFIGPKHNTLLNYFFIQPWLPYSLLWIRATAAIGYALSLLILIRACFRGGLDWLSGLTFLACFSLDVFSMATWSHNWWARDLLLFHTAALYYGKPRYAGCAMGLLVANYNPLIAAALVTVFFLPRQSRWYYAAFALLGIGSDFSYLLGKGLLSDWKESLASTAALQMYQANTSASKLGHLFSYVIQLREFWILAIGLSTAWWGKRWLGRSQRLFMLTTSIIGIAIFGKRLIVGWPFVFLGANTLVGLGLGGGMVLFFYTYPRTYLKESQFKNAATVAALLTALTMAMSSMTGNTALIWAMPALVIPLVAEVRRQSFAAVWMPTVSLMLLFISVAGVYHSLTSSYFDVPPAKCTTEIRTAPLQGIKTSARRAFLIEELAKLVRDKKYVLPYPTLPGALYFGKARSARDFTFEIESYVPETIRRISLIRMVDRERFPEVVIRLKQHAWAWGQPEGALSFSPTFEISKKDFFERFLRCIKAETVADFAEFEAFSVDGSKVKPCALDTLAPQVG